MDEQRAMLRHFLDFIVARIHPDDVGPDQADPASPDAEWPERPKPR